MAKNEAARLAASKDPDVSQVTRTLPSGREETVLTRKTRLGGGGVDAGQRVYGAGIKGVQAHPRPKLSTNFPSRTERSTVSPSRAVDSPSRTAVSSHWGRGAPPSGLPSTTRTTPPPQGSGIPTPKTPSSDGETFSPSSTTSAGTPTHRGSGIPRPKTPGSSGIPRPRTPSGSGHPTRPKTPSGAHMRESPKEDQSPSQVGAAPTRKGSSKIPTAASRLRQPGK